MTSILHVIAQVAGGAGASMINLAAGSTQTGEYSHTILSLAPIDETTQQHLKQRGFGILSRPDKQATWQALDDADIVHVHYWNTPSLNCWLQKDFPPLRMLLHIHIGGLFAPQVITSALVDMADLVVTTSPTSAAVPAFANNFPTTICDVADLNRVAGVMPVAHDLFTVGYLGTISFVKMHPDFVALCARIDVPGTRFVVCGAPANGKQLMQQAAALGIAAQFELRGYIGDLCNVLAEIDVFGYPLCADNYASSDLVLQEVMAAGIPAVILKYGATPYLVQHNRTGYVVETEDDYCRAVEYLAYHPAERLRLGQAARLYAAQHFGIDTAVSQFHNCYNQLLRQDKHTHDFCLQSVNPSFMAGDPLQGADLFVASLGAAAKPFITSLTAPDDEALHAEAIIAASSPVLCSENGGGIFHYRNAFPRDPWLRLWSGLALSGQGQHVRALSEFKAAVELGWREWRVYWYMARLAVQLRAWPTARGYLNTVFAQVSDFSPAVQLAGQIQS